MKSKKIKIAKEKKIKIKKPQKQLTLEKEIYKASLLVNISSGGGIFIMILIGFLIRRDQWIACLIYLVVLVAIAEGLVAKISNHLIIRKLSNNFEKWRRGELNEDERTTLFSDLMSFPFRRKWLEAMCIYSFTAFGFVFLCHFTPQIGLSWHEVMASLFMAAYGSFFSAYATFLTTESVCNKYAVDVVKSGLVAERVMQKKSYGMDINMRIFLYIVVPIFLSIFINVNIASQAYKLQNGQYVSLSLHASRVIFFTVFWILIIFSSLWAMSRDIIRNNDILCRAINKMLTSDVSTGDDSVYYADTDLNGKTQYNTFLLNQLIGQFRGILGAASGTSRRVREMTEGLSVVSSELAATSLEQSADVKEILGTMEEANKLSQTIRKQTMGVTDGSDRTNDDVAAADEALEGNRQQIESISESNRQIIERVQSLGRQVDNIDDVVAMIKDIADQTRIIAFNAELEAVGAGDEGRNFHIVAAETRRLASNTMESISNIQQYIEAIKEAAGSLIGSSESQTLHIQEEMQTIREMVTHFGSIKESAEHTSSKAAEIESVVDQQTSSFSQIVVTLRQIGAGVESFTGSARSISESAGGIRDISSRLDNLQAGYQNTLTENETDISIP